MPPSINRIYRYPIKGLSPEKLESVTLEPGRCLPYDRRFALSRADSVFDPKHPEHVNKTNFFMLMKNAQLAQLKTRVDTANDHFVITRNDEVILEADLKNPKDRSEVEHFFTDFLDGEPGLPVRLVDSLGHAFGDARRRPNAQTGQYISLVNLASCDALAKTIQNAIDPIRFRANIYFHGIDAWQELDYVEHYIQLGQARLHTVSPITRCAATSVNPDTAERDLNLPRNLIEHFGHNYMGIYAEVIQGGKIAPGDTLELY